MNLLSAYQIAASVVFSLMTSLWICSLILDDASIVDRFWGAGFVLISWALYLATPQITAPMTLLTIIVSIWGLRLSFYIHWRNRGHGEDYRYVEMRQHHGKNFWWYSFISVFLLQGALMLIVAAPVIYVLSAAREETISFITLTGAWLWLVGFIFEAGGDLQLWKFKKSPTNKGKLLTSGLWSISRHPNYFGDSLQWWGFGLFAVSSLEWTGIMTLIGPVVMMLFIIKVSGVALLEKNLKTSKPGYEQYISETPAFFPSWRFWTFLIAGAVVVGALNRILTA